MGEAEQERFRASILRLIDEYGGIRALSRAGDISENTLKSWKGERGSTPRADILMHFAEALGKSIDRITGSNSSKHPNEIIARIIEMLEPLDDETLRKMREMIRACLELKSPPTKERLRKIG